MAKIGFRKTATLPGTLAANTLYFVESGSYAESYLTDDTGVAKSLGNSAMIQAVAEAAIQTALADQALIEIVDDITERDALAPERNVLALVEDATGDATVASGAALYAYVEAGDRWDKIAEYEGLDVTVQWADVQGKPASQPSLIDDAVNRRHSHSNKTLLDKLSDAAGDLLYDGEPVSGTVNWDALDW